MKLIQLLVFLTGLLPLSMSAEEQCNVQTTECFGYTSTTSHFVCNYCPYHSGNCTWWAAYKRPDIAAAITGSGWDGGQWYDKLKNLGFSVGPEPRAGAVVEFSKPGHEAYVESVGDNEVFNVSEMDAYGSPGFVNGVNYATYSPNGDGTYSRNGGSTRWTLKGFIYHRQGGTNLYCDSLSSIWKVCWTPSETDVSCHGGTNWTLYDFEQGSIIRVSTNKYCLETGGIGGGVPSDAPDPQSSTPDPVNLALDFDILDPNTMNELYAGQGKLQQGQTVRLNAQLEAEQGNAKDWMDPGKNTIETDFYAQINGGTWSNIGREYT